MEGIVSPGGDDVRSVVAGPQFVRQGALGHDAPVPRSQAFDDATISVPYDHIACGSRQTTQPESPDCSGQRITNDSNGSPSVGTTSKLLTARRYPSVMPRYRLGHGGCDSWKFPALFKNLFQRIGVFGNGQRPLKPRWVMITCLALTNGDC